MTTSERPISALASPGRASLSSDLAALWQAVENDLGFVPNFIRAYSLNDEHLRTFFAYFTGLLDPAHGRLPVRDREFLAVVVSSENRCSYCMATHGAILREITGDPAFVDRIAVNYRHVELTERDRALADFAIELTREPAAAEPARLEPLRRLGLDDGTVLEVIEVVAAFNFTNRLTNAIGLQPEDEFLAAHRVHPTPRPSPETT